MTYVCTCYGATDIAASDDPKISESVVSAHHDAPRYVLAKADKGRRIVPAPFKNHTDLELTLIESLVGRNPPFSARLDFVAQHMRHDLPAMGTISKMKKPR